MKNYTKPEFIDNKNLFQEVVNAASGEFDDPTPTPAPFTCTKRWGIPNLYDSGLGCSRSCPYAVMQDDYLFGKKIGSHMTCTR